MSIPDTLDPPSSPPSFDSLLSGLSDASRVFAAMGAGEKASLLRATLPLWVATGRETIVASCAAKGLDPASPTAGEEWFSGPFATQNLVRLLITSLDDIQKRGRPRLAGAPKTRKGDGRVSVPLALTKTRDRLLFRDHRADAWMAPGATRESVEATQARAYQAPAGDPGVALVLGAGNVASASVMDALTKLFVEGKAVLLKMSPINAYLGPLIERGLAPLIAPGFLRVVYGDSDVGSELSVHPLVTEVHLTGSRETHERLVWGLFGAQREARKAAGDPLLKKPVTSALGNVTPFLMMPFLYAKDELRYQAESVVTQVVNNASFNCHAAKMLVLPSGWPQRELFLSMIKEGLSRVAPRFAFHPGAENRHALLTAGRERVFFAGGLAQPPTLPWVLVEGLDPNDAEEPLFRTEPFCGIVSEVSVGSADPIAFLAAATAFCNERLWGTLSAQIAIHPLHEEDPAIEAALDRALAELRYGAIGVNQWPALLYGLAAPPWGGHPSATLADVQSGLGFVHNTSMLEGVDKVVLRGPLRAFPKPYLASNNRRMNPLGEKLAAYAAAPGLGKALSIARFALRG